eukprot:scaffold11273_cov67-Isochrysis_galbana.AAC.1
MATQSSAAPSAPQAMPYRAEVRHAKGPANPRAVGSIACSGTRTASSKMEPVMEARRESLFWMGGVASAPGCRRSTADRSIRKPRTAPASASARAHT